MKRIISLVSIIGIFSVSQYVYADSITDTYNTGDTLTATTLNNIKSAVNDNDSRVDTLEAADLINRITALEAELTAHKADLANPHAVTKEQVGLSNLEDIRVNFTATTAPTVDDDINDGYSVGSVWIDVTQKEAYVLVDSTAGLAVWKPVTNNYAIGDVGPAGGVVFYITDNGLHGLEAARTVLSAATWGCDGADLTGADGTAVGTGAQNTADILADCAESGIAAELATAYSISGESGWHLPSGDELSLLHFRKDYVGKDLVGGLPDQDYWSSSETGIASAVCQNISNGNKGNCTKTGSRRVLPIRAF
jgi:hypothetical protein